MKLFLKLFAVVMLAGALVCGVKALPVMIVGSLTTVNNTSANSTVAPMLSYNPAAQLFQIAHGTLTATSALTLNVYAGTTGTTNGCVQIGTWNPSNTNAVTEYINANAFAVTNYIFVTAVTTNSVTVGGSYGQ